MNSNFFFIENWADMYAAARQAEQYVNQDPRTACFYARRALEQGVYWLYANESYLERPRHSETLSALINTRTFKENLDPGVFEKLDLIRRLGNKAVHHKGEVATHEALQALQELHHFSYWLFRYYSPERRTLQPKPFNAQLLPKGSAEPSVPIKQLQQLEAELEARDKEKQALEEKLLQQENEYKALLARQAQVAQQKAHNRQLPIEPHDYNEAQTRKYLIDLQLQEQGWNLDDPRCREYAVTGMPLSKSNPRGNGKVDYVLWGDNGLPLAVIEAKRTARDPHTGRQQASLYADCLEASTGQRPFVFYTNGFETYFWDDRRYPPRKVQGFYSKAALERLLHRRTALLPLTAPEATVNTDIVDRPYQLEAIRRLCEHFESHQRKGLVVMATGTGKTRTVAALCDLLMRRNWVKRVLFLADRNALVSQACRAFQRHLPEVSTEILNAQKPASNARVCFSTYPTMMSSLKKQQYGVGHFDLIVVDEAHRSVYHKFKAIFDYYDSLLVGLTATPRDEIDRNTYELFEMEDGIPTFAYEAVQAFSDGVLVPPQAVSVPLKFQREGIAYAHLSEAEQEEYETLFYDDEHEVLPETIQGSALNRWLFNRDTVDKVLACLMEEGQKVQGGDQLGKTIIFAQNIPHANFIRDRFEANYPHYLGSFAEVVAYNVSHVESLIDDFGNPEKDRPTIAISVDMLDTGIDVPDILNLVFFKAVYSRTKFHQMMGRGTRLCPDLFGPGQHKTHFLALDFCQNFEFFDAQPEGKVTRSSKSLAERVFAHRLRLLQAVGSSQHPVQRSEAEQKALKSLKNNVTQEMVALTRGMHHDNFLVRPHWELVEKYQQPEAWAEVSTEDLPPLIEKLAKLPSEHDPGHESARRFDLLLLSLQVDCLEAGEPDPGRVSKVKALAAQLEEKTTLPAVQAQLPLLQEVQTVEYWQHVTPYLLEMLRQSLRELMIYLDKGAPQAILYSNFEDEMGPLEVKELPATFRAGLQQYHHKIKVYLQAHSDHIALYRLRHNKPMTAQDLASLEDMLLSAGSTGQPEEIAEVLAAAKASHQSLGLFIRSLVGLDRAAAKEAFGDFLQQGHYTANQMDFVNRIINLLTEKGEVKPEQLYDRPFTDLHQMGVDGLFDDDASDKIVSILRAIHANAEVAL